MVREEDIAQMKFEIPTFVLFLGIVSNSTLSYAKPEYAKKKERLHLRSCERPFEDLNDAGKYYKEHDHSLAGYYPKK